MTALYQSAYSQTPPFDQYTIMLDPGHGGHDGGGFTTHRISEKVYNNRLCKVLNQKLQAKGFNITWTRKPDEDPYIPTTTRAEMANEQKPDLFLSIHHDMNNQSSKIKGFSVFYSSYRTYTDKEDIYICVNSNWYHHFLGEERINNITHAYFLDSNEKKATAKHRRDQFCIYDKTPCPCSIKSRKVAGYLGQELSTLTFIKPLQGKRTAENDFIVIRRTNIPSVLIEAGFLSNPTEEKLLANRENIESMANAITKGLCLYFSKLEESNGIGNE